MNDEEKKDETEAAAEIPAAVDIDEADDVEAAEQNLAAMEKAEEDEGAEDPEGLDEQVANNMLRNVTLADAEIRMFGDRTVLAQIAQLLAYVRHAVKNDQPTEIRLSVCKSESTVSGAEFMFDLNGCQVPDIVPQAEAFIN